MIHTWPSELLCSSVASHVCGNGDGDDEVSQDEDEEDSIGSCIDKCTMAVKADIG